MAEGMYQLDKEHQRTAIVNDKVLTGCWMCRHLIRPLSKDNLQIHWCGAKEEYTELTNIHIVPKGCRYMVDTE